jgi:hypothetical protein
MAEGWGRATMICSNCGARMERGSTECPQCGALVQGPRYGLRRTFGAPPPARPPRTRPSWRPSTLGQFVKKAPGGAPMAELGRNLLSRVSEQLGLHQNEEPPIEDLSAGLARVPRRPKRSPGGYDSFGPERDSFGPEPDPFARSGSGEPRRAPRTPYPPERGSGTPRGIPQRSGRTPNSGAQRAGPTPFAQRSGPTPYAAPREARVPGRGGAEPVQYGPAGEAAMEDPWSSVAQPQYQPPQPPPQQQWSAVPSQRGSGYLDTGQGWSVAMQRSGSTPYSGYYSAKPERAPSLAGTVLGLFGGSLRALFNFVIVIFAILFLTVPVLIGLQRIGALHILDAAHVAQTTPRPVPTAPAGFQTYITPSFDLASPSAWRYTQTTRTFDSWGTVHDGHLEDATNTLIGATVTTLPAVPVDQHQSMLEANTLNAFRGRAANIITTSPVNSTVNMDGSTWLRETFNFDVATGQQSRAMRGLAMITTHGLTTYIFLMYAPAESFDSVQAQQFNVMLSSFRFVP